MGVSASGNYWVLESGHAAYAMGVEPGGVLVHTYWGRRLPRLADYPAAARARYFSADHELQLTPQEVTTGEASASDERTLDATIAGGHLRGLVLRFESADVGDDTLAVTLRDADLNLRVVLTYGTLDQHGLFTRSLAVINDGGREVQLTRAFTGAFNLPAGGEFALNHLSGRWGDEFRMHRDPMGFGTIQRDSRRVITSHGGVPYFAVDRNEPGLAASEEAGEVWFGTLQWSGNWRLIAERTRDDRGIIHLGLNDHDFAWDLQPGETFEAPRVVYGYSSEGFGAMSRAYHDLIRRNLSPRPNFVPPVVYNSWYATLFDVDQEGQTALAEKASKMGVELFVMDDGWFHGRNTDKAGLGDWWPDETKFPKGLAPLIDAVKSHGMQFGLWIEPEMVNPDSDLYRAHPDWVLHYEGRERSLMRNQLILNLGRVDVQDYLIDIFDRLLTENSIDFIKWDMNRSASEAGWPTHERDAREIWVRYVEGLYRVWVELRARHPDVIWENCCSGGGRVDLGMMALTEQSWTSDNTVPAARLLIQEGYSQLFPANTMAGWATDEERREYPLDFRFHVSMAGALGVGGNLLDWSDEECSVAAGHVARFKEIRHLVAGGDLYRLRSAHRHAVSAFAYVARDKSEAVLFVFRVHSARLGANPTIRIAGLDPEALYAVEGSDVVRSGRAWAEIGLISPIKNLQSQILRFTRV
ncbi:alpha-galactosidase [Kaistia sp. 32K]|uniref:alpha-galactosidase n=1 Tax=Kaistia sp. 32K TaxID=2795690 RepID=UPI0019166ADC|nr:alpha-galactosidase [Kaistia sp. 32K]BCP55273.1 alpha-galactosidase [Kaistia sp. 32K]